MASYVSQHPDSYNAYTGPVAHAQNIPITTQAFGYKQEAPAAPGMPDFDEYYRAKQQNAMAGPDNLNPYNTASMSQQMAYARNQARLIPGSLPTYGALPGGRVIDFRTWEPVSKVDPWTQAFANVAGRANITPSYLEALGRGYDFSGRGYQFKGDPSQQELELGRRFLSGDMGAGQQLARLRGARIGINAKPWSDKLMKGITLAAIAAGFSAMGGAALGPVMGSTLGAAAGGAIGGGLTSTVASHGDWRQALIGAGAGAASSLAGSGAGALARGAGAGSGVAGAASGLAGGATGAAIRGIGTGNVRWEDVLKGAALGGVSGGVSGYAKPVIQDYLVDNYGMNPYEASELAGWAARVAGQGVGTGAGLLFPDDYVEDQRARAAKAAQSKNPPKKKV